MSLRALVGAILVWGSVLGSLFAGSGSAEEIQARGKAMVREAEDMVMHGGMGDGAAIVHHCAEVRKHAEAILKLLPSRDEHSQKAAPHLQDAIGYCQRVAEMGDKVDPGQSLNPAAKARAAAREALKHLSNIRGT
jgi:thioredoxin-like negative regulator of GroEL